MTKQSIVSKPCFALGNRVCYTISLIILCLLLVAPGCNTSQDESVTEKEKKNTETKRDNATQQKAKEKRPLPTAVNDEAATLIEAREFKLFWADKDPEQGILHMDFNLKASGGSIGLAQVVKQEIHEIHLLYYDNQSSDIAFGRYPDGGSMLSVLFPTPGSSNIMTGLPGDGDDPARLRVYPNPADQFVNIEIRQLDRPALGELVNMTGQIINQFQIMPGEPVRIDVTGIPTGMYLFRISAPTALSAKIMIH